MILVASIYSHPAMAQAQVWIQIETKNNLRETKERAQFFANDFADTHAFQTTGGLYTIVLGPMSRDEATAELIRLKADNSIPADSFVTDGASYRNQLWPLTANTTTTAETGTVVVEEPTTEEPAATAGIVVEPATETVVEPAAEPVAEPATETVAAVEPVVEPASEPVAEIEVATTEPEPVTEPVTEVATPEPEPVVEEVPAGPIQDEDFAETRKLERTWTRDEKKQYQVYMVWTGDYDKAIDGAYGPGTRKAIKGFQTREGYQDTGYLTADQLALLQKRYDDIIAVLGLEGLRDLDAGIELQFPANLVEFDRFEPPFVQFKSKNDSKVRMMLVSQEGGREMLNSLYDIMETFDFIPPEGYRVRKRDWFVLSGRNDDVVSYSYVRTNRDTVKGFTLIWPPERDTEMQPLATAMYNSFTTLDEYVLDETLGYGQEDDQPMDLTTGLETAEPDKSATGFYINEEGVILTHVANVSRCARITIAEGSVGGGVEYEVLSEDKVSELAVLKPKDSHSPGSFALFSGEKPELGSEITVAGFSFPEVMEIATLNYGTLTDTNGTLGDPSKIRVSAFLEHGDTGGPVLDDRGAVIGMRLLKASGSTGQPEYVNFALKSERIMQQLDLAQLVYGKSTAFESLHSVDLAFMAGDFTVKVSCWR